MRAVAGALQGRMRTAQRRLPPPEQAQSLRLATQGMYAQIRVQPGLTMGLELLEGLQGRFRLGPIQQQITPALEQNRKRSGGRQAAQPVEGLIQRLQGADPADPGA
ncbi:MAG: hypothetical protein ACOVLH_05470 [Roseateles sp.]